MTATSKFSATIDDAYRARTPVSEALYKEAQLAIPSGITHDSRFTFPYPISVARALGPRKWDVDGNEYVDYFGGHGALLLGHSHPAVVEAVQQQMALGTHWGASHLLEVRWAQVVQRMIPSAQRVRFTASGTEASHLALRLARAYTGKPKSCVSSAIFTVGITRLLRPQCHISMDQYHRALRHRFLTNRLCCQSKISRSSSKL